MFCPTIIFSDNEKSSRRYSASPPYGLSYKEVGAAFTAQVPYTAAIPFQTDGDEDLADGSIVGNVRLTDQPSMSFTRKTWWDSLLTMYAWTSPNATRALTNSEREQTSQQILSDIRSCFRASNCWFSFFHLPTFFSTYCDPIKRESMQPSLIFAILAHSTFWASSERGLGEAGRAKALRLRAQAQGHLEASLNVGWIDETLAQAAWVRESFIKAALQ
jgi:hypothetical protein